MNVKKGSVLLYLAFWVSFVVIGCYYLISFNTFSSHEKGILTGTEVISLKNELKPYHVKELFTYKTGSATKLCSIIRETGYPSKSKASEAASVTNTLLGTQRDLWTFFSNDSQCYDQGNRNNGINKGIIFLLIPNGILGFLLLFAVLMDFDIPELFSEVFCCKPLLMDRTLEFQEKSSSIPPSPTTSQDEEERQEDDEEKAIPSGFRFPFVSASSSKKGGGKKGEDWDKPDAYMASNRGGKGKYGGSISALAISAAFEDHAYVASGSGSRSGDDYDPDPNIARVSTTISRM
jgi:hypothetical protein